MTSCSPSWLTKKPSAWGLSSSPGTICPPPRRSDLISPNQSRHLRRAPLRQPQPDDLRKRVHAAVAAKLGTQVDPALLDAILDRVLAALERK